jgi:hypothetical protein
MNLLTLVARLHVALLAIADHPLPPPGHGGRMVPRGRGDRGQATTEYALVLLAAALVALLLIAWATAGGGAAKIGRLFDRVIDAVIDKV